MDPIFDRRAVRLHRDRAAATVERVSPILQHAAAALLDRIDDTTQRFSRALDVGGRGVVAPALRARGIATIACDLSARMAARSGPPCVAVDEEWLPFAPGSFDLVVANLSLHWVNDLPGALIQLRRALTTNGLLLASVPTLGTLTALRTALIVAEQAATGGASPRISPFPELRDMAGLMQRAGFVLPVADADVTVLQYADPWALVRDLRDAGETNATVLRSRRPLAGAVLAQALAGLPAEDGRAGVTLNIATVTGWADAVAPVGTARTERSQQN